MRPDTSIVRKDCLIETQCFKKTCVEKMSNLGCFISLNLSAISCQKKSMSFLPLNNTKYWRMPGSGAAGRSGKPPASGFRFGAQLLAHSGGLRASLPHTVSDYPSVKARKYNQHPGTIFLYWHCGPVCATHTLMASLAVAFSTFYVTPNIPKKVTTEILTDLKQLPLPRRESKMGNTDLYPALPAAQVFATDYFASGWVLRSCVNSHQGRENPSLAFSTLLHTHLFALPV